MSGASSKRRSIAMRRPPRNLRKVQIDLSPKQITRLKWLVEQTDSLTMSEVVRDSIDFFAVLTLLTGQGKSINAIDPLTGEVEVLIPSALLPAPQDLPPCSIVPGQFCSGTCQYVLKAGECPHLAAQLEKAKAITNRFRDLHSNREP